MIVLIAFLRLILNHQQNKENHVAIQQAEGLVVKIPQSMKISLRMERT